MHANVIIKWSLLFWFTCYGSLLQDADIEHYGLDNSPIDQMDSEWLDNFFHDPVLNDRMMTDALQPQHVQSEHSYSLTNGEKVTLNGQIKVEPTDKGEIEAFIIVKTCNIY